MLFGRAVLAHYRVVPVGGFRWGNSLTMTAGAADDAEIAARATAPDGWRVGDVWSFYVERLTTHDDAWARIPMPPAEAPVAPRLVASRQLPVRRLPAHRKIPAASRDSS